MPSPTPIPTFPSILASAWKTRTFQRDFGGSQNSNVTRTHMLRSNRFRDPRLAPRIPPVHELNRQTFRRIKNHIEYRVRHRGSWSEFPVSVVPEWCRRASPWPTHKIGSSRSGRFCSSAPQALPGQQIIANHGVSVCFSSVRGPTASVGSTRTVGGSEPRQEARRRRRSMAE